MKNPDGEQRLVEVMTRLDKTFKPKLNEDLDQPVEEFIPHGTYSVSNAGGYEIMLDDSGDAAKVRDAFGSDNPKTSDWLEIVYVSGKPVIDPNGYNIPLSQVMRIQGGINEKNDKWIQKAVDPAHKGYCTPMTKDTCTPRRKALAKRFKAGIEDESIMEAFVGDNPEEYRVMVEKLKQSMDNLFQEQHFDIIDTLYRLIVERKRPLAPQIAETNENIHNTAQMGGILNSRGTAGYNPDAGQNNFYRMGVNYGKEAWNWLMSKLQGEDKDVIFTNQDAYIGFTKGVDWSIQEESSQMAADLFAKNAGAAPDEMV